MSEYEDVLDSRFRERWMYEIKNSFETDIVVSDKLLLTLLEVVDDSLKTKESNEEKIQDLEWQVEDSDSEFRSLQSTIEELESEKTDLQFIVTDLEWQVRELGNKLFEAENK